MDGIIGGSCNIYIYSYISSAYVYSIYIQYVHYKKSLPTRFFIYFELGESRRLRFCKFLCIKFRIQGNLQKGGN